MITITTNNNNTKAVLKCNLRAHVRRNPQKTFNDMVTLVQLIAWFRRAFVWANVDSAHGVTNAYYFYQFILNTGNCIEQSVYFPLNIHPTLDIFINKPFSSFN